MDLFGRLASRLMENSTELVVRMVLSSSGKRAASLTACGGDAGTARYHHHLCYSVQKKLRELMSSLAFAGFIIHNSRRLFDNYSYRSMPNHVLGFDTRYERIPCFDVHVGT
jgi:hypothetical protein